MAEAAGSRDSPDGGHPPASTILCTNRSRRRGNCREARARAHGKIILLGGGGGFLMTHSQSQEQTQRPSSLNAEAFSLFLLLIMGHPSKAEPT